MNFLGVGLHNYGFTAGKDTIWKFYAVIGVMMIFGAVIMLIERSAKKTVATGSRPSSPDLRKAD